MSRVHLSPASVILFDLDGTLIDTEKYYRIAWPQACHDFGYPMTDEQSLTMRSLGKPFVYEHFREMFGTDRDYSAIRIRRQEIMQDLLREGGLQARPHAAEALELLKQKGYRLAVTTASDLERTETYLTRLSLRSYFDDLLSTYMVARGKPAPDVYLLACRTLGIEPARAIAVEDAPNGIRSAAAAGCQTVMIPDQSGPDAELSALIAGCFGDLLEFAETVDRYNG